MRGIKIPVQDFAVKMQGGLSTREVYLRKYCSVLRPLQVWQISAQYTRRPSLLAYLHSLHKITLTTLVDCKQGNSSTTSQTNGPFAPVIHWRRLVKVVSMSCFTTAWSHLCLPFFHSDFGLATAFWYSSSVISSLSFCCSLGSCLRRFEGGCWQPCFEADGGFLFSSSSGQFLRKFLNAVLSDSFHDPYGVDRCLVIYLVTTEQLVGNS